MISFPIIHTDLISPCCKWNCRCIWLSTSICEIQTASFTNALNISSVISFILLSLIIARSYERALQTQLQGIKEMYSSSYIDKNILGFRSCTYVMTEAYLTAWVTVWVMLTSCVGKCAALVLFMSYFTWRRTRTESLPAATVRVELKFKMCGTAESKQNRHLHGEV